MEYNQPPCGVMWSQVHVVVLKRANQATLGISKERSFRLKLLGCSNKNMLETSSKSEQELMYCVPKTY